MQLAERGTQLSKRFWVREIRKFCDSGHQTSILATNFQAPIATLAPSLFARGSQENFSRYMREHYGLERSAEYGTDPFLMPSLRGEPPWRKLDGQIRSKLNQRHCQAAEFGALALSPDPSDSELQGFQQRKAHLREEIETLDL